MKAIDTVYFQELINNYKAKQEERANKGLGLEYFGPKEMQMLIDKIPIIEAEPVRHGRWINPRLNKYGHPCHQCNQCLFVASQKDRNFCPDCGAKMDLKE